MAADGPPPGARTPAEDGFAMPAEWESHAACYISWPCKPETWLGFESQVKSAYVNVARAISRFEPVIVLSPKALVGEARERLGRGIYVEEIELDDSWIRDNGPTFVRSESAQLAIVQFGFNGWGERYTPYANDAKVPEELARRLALTRYRAPIIAEGGAITVDGQGTVITTESCLLNPNRNSGRSKEEVEKALRSYLGVRKVLWLRRGMHQSQVDGHVDGIASFVRPGLVMAATMDDPADPNYEILRENRERLVSATDARGRSIEVLDLPFPTRRQLHGHRIAASFMNFYLANGGVVVPTFGDPADDRALDAVRRAFPEREVIGVRGEFIGLGGGIVHCITQQLPTGTNLARLRTGEA
jgi:agmatine deiminase